MDTPRSAGRLSLAIWIVWPRVLARGFLDQTEANWAPGTVVFRAMRPLILSLGFLAAATAGRVSNSGLMAAYESDSTKNVLLSGALVCQLLPTGTPSKP